jgi:ATP-dependent Lhr-like helicase
MEGHWLRIDAPPAERDVLEEEELVKDRIRQLFKRYGVLFRDLLANELPPLQWRSIFRSLRLMELSGEVLSGYFFEGISGPQFISHEAFWVLQEPLPQDAVFWINATDPASLCGLGLESIHGLPPRIASTHLVYRGNRLVMISKRLGKSLDIFVEPDDARLADYLGLFKDLLAREFQPVQRIVVEAINDAPALSSPFAGALREFGFRSARSALELWKEF